jgi:RHS repeat-associated protein
VPIQPALPAASQQFSYDTAAQLTSATSDTLGRVTAQNGRTYTWNLASQLTSFMDAANSGEFTYDGLGEMNSSTASGAAESYVYNYLFRLPALSIVRVAAADLRYYVYLPNGTLLYSIEAAGNARHFYLFDEIGNTVLLTDDTGALSDSYAVTPYGEVQDHFGTTDNPFTWQGQYGVIQEGTGLYFVRSRHYDAFTARFVSRDPVVSANPRSSEPYAYAGGNPLLETDPFGADIDVSQLTPLEVDSILMPEIQSGGITVDNPFEQIMVVLFDDSVQSNADIDWQDVATNLGLVDPSSIFTFLNAEIQTLETPKTVVQAVQAAVTPPASPPPATPKSLPDTGKATPVLPVPCGICEALQISNVENAMETGPADPQLFGDMATSLTGTPATVPDPLNALQQ